MFSLVEIAGMILTLVVYGAYIFLIAFTLWMAIDAGKQDRFWWMVLIIGIPFVGSGVYFFTEKKHEYAKAESHHIHDSETEEQHETSPHKKKGHRKKEIPHSEKIEEVASVATELREETKEASLEEKKETDLSTS